MGTGYEATCSKCTYHAEFFLGSGMLFPNTYKSVQKDISNGNTAKNGRLFWLITQELYSTRKGSCTAAVNATSSLKTIIFLYMSARTVSPLNTVTGPSGAIMEKNTHLLSAILTGARDAAAAW